METKSKIMTKRLIEEVVPASSSIEVGYSGDEPMIQYVCRELKCFRTEIVLTRDEVIELMSSIDEYDVVRLTIVDFSDL